ncbi:MAG TPA: hypothetical protein VHE30_04660 [Polyangiaceae bacterium]|nr:hypothetical protein [Polyangiaceae bacterium]
MSVDGVGGGGRRPIGPSGVGGVAPGAPSAASGPAAGTAAASATGVQGSPALERLSRGEIGIGEYLDGRVSEAVKHLEGRVSAEQLDFVKQSLRAELSTDPVLSELVRRTTGSVPAADID